MKERSRFEEIKKGRKTMKEIKKAVWRFQNDRKNLIWRNKAGKKKNERNKESSMKISEWKKEFDLKK